MTTHYAEVALSIRNLTKVYPRRTANGQIEHLPVIDPISRDVAAGRFVAIIGPSGCGKSSLLELIAGLRPRSAGEIYVWGQRPARLKAVVQVDLPRPRGIQLLATHEFHALAGQLWALLAPEGSAT